MSNKLKIGITQGDINGIGWELILKVFADGRIITSASYIPSPGERISVRGYGKFRYLGTDGTTRKGRLIAKFERYV
jgi:RNA-binding protein YlmH